MQDDNNKPENDLPQVDNLDDIDLEEDDFEDVAWDDDFDDLDDDLDDELAAMDGNAPASKPSKTASQKSFFSRNFNTIVIGAAVLGGLGWFLISMSKPPTTPRQAPEEQMQQQAVDPIPQDQGGEEQQTANTFDTPESSIGFMKDPGSILDGLEAAEAQRNANKPPMPTPVQTQAVPEMEEAEPLTPFPADFLKTAKEDNADTGTQLPSLDEVKNTENMDFVIVPETVKEEPLPVTTAQEKELAVISMDEAPAIKAAPAPKVEQAVISSAQASVEVTALTEKMEEMETFVTSSSADINAQISVLNNKIEQLTTLIEQLSEENKKAAALAAQTARTAAVAPKVAKPAPAKAEEPKAAPPVAAKKPQTPAKETPVKQAAPTKQVAKPKTAAPARAKTTNNWKLRGAGANQAMIAPEGSNQITTVSVGETVKGLGKITFIGQENGLWVVRGTQGEVRQ